MVGELWIRHKRNVLEKCRCCGGGLMKCVLVLNHVITSSYYDSYRKWMMSSRVLYGTCQLKCTLIIYNLLFHVPFFSCSFLLLFFSSVLFFCSFLLVLLLFTSFLVLFWYFSAFYHDTFCGRTALWSVLHVYTQS